MFSRGDPHKAVESEETWLIPAPMRGPIWGLSAALPNSSGLSVPLIQDEYSCSLQSNICREDHGNVYRLNNRCLFRVSELLENEELWRMFELIVYIRNDACTYYMLIIYRTHFSLLNCLTLKVFAFTRSVAVIWGFQGAPAH